jgi:hypothetical protein
MRGHRIAIPADLRSGLQKNARGRTGLDDYLALLAGLGGVLAPRFSEDGGVHQLEVRMGTATGLTVQQGPDPSHDTVARNPPQIPCATRPLVVSRSITLGRAVGRGVRGCKQQGRHLNSAISTTGERDGTTDLRASAIFG